MQKLASALFKGLIVSGLTTLICATANAEVWPSKTIKLIVPYSAGGSTDITARKIADLLKKESGYSIVVENRPGAGSTRAAGQLSRGRNTGHTVLMASPGHILGPTVYPRLKYDPIEDFKFIRRIMATPNVMVIPASAPHQNVKEFVSAAKSQEMTFSSPVLGSSIHMSGEFFKNLTDTQLTHVPFRGSSEAIPALISGDVDVSFENLTAALPYIQSGRLRALAVTSKIRSPFLPDVPTMSETGVGLGLENFVISSWFGLIANKSFDEGASKTLQSLLDEIVASQSFTDFLAQRGAIAATESGDDFKAFIIDETIKWSSVTKQADINY